MPPKPSTKTATKSTGTKTGVKPATKGPAKPATKGATKGASAPAKDDVKKVEADMAKMTIKKVIEPVTIPLKDIAPLVLKMAGDVGDNCKESGRWLFIIDKTGGNVHTFLKYRDVNMISVTSPVDFQAEPLRRNLQGALKYGKPHVLDISDTDQAKAIDLVKNKYNEIYDGCWDDLMGKKILEEDSIAKLYRPGDDQDQLQNPLSYDGAHFNFVVYTNVDPASYANDSFFPVIIE